MDIGSIHSVSSVLSTVPGTEQVISKYLLNESDGFEVKDNYSILALDIDQVTGHWGKNDEFRYCKFSDLCLLPDSMLYSES